MLTTSSGLHLLSFIAVIANRARRENFKGAFGYDGYNAPKHRQAQMELDQVDENGVPIPAAPRRIYVV